MTKGLQQTIVRQFGRPSGGLGRLAGWIMATRPSNRERNRWTVELLAPRPGDEILELGCGPGLALAECARHLVTGTVTGVDHSPAMLEQAASRNRKAIRAGRVTLHAGGVDFLIGRDSCYDKLFSVNVIQFLDDQDDFYRACRATLRPGGLLATTYMPRGRGADRDTALDTARRVEAAMARAGFEAIRREELPLKPVPAVCVLGRRPES